VSTIAPEPAREPVETRTARRLLGLHQDALNRHDVPALAALYAEDAILDSPMFSQVRGRAAIAQSFADLFHLFPDYTIRSTEALFLGREQRVAEFSTVRGTHSVEFHGLPATGQEIEYQTARLFTIRNELIVHERRLYDFRGVLDRLEKAQSDREMAMASVVQQALCRTNYSSQSCAFVASSLPCRTIGGDFVEYLELPGAGFGFAVGDVAGKGPAAALVAAMLQGMFSIVASTGESQPSAVLSTLNRGLHARDVHPKFATLVYGNMAADGRFTYSNAGHQPPLLVRQNAVRVLSAGGPILGVFDHATFPAETVQLSPGDMIVAFSDGVTDASASDGSDFGMDRLVAVAASAAKPTARELLAHVIHSIEEFAGSVPQADDITVAVVQYRGPFLAP
jgi:steroid delta-isomerase-like uncharacterized protein